jgi:hypothetical protein
LLIEGYTETLRELNYRIRAVGSDPGHEDRPSFTLIKSFGRLNGGRGKASPNEFAQTVDIALSKSGVFRV